MNYKLPELENMRELAGELYNQAIELIITERGRQKEADEPQEIHKQFADIMGEADNYSLNASDFAEYMLDDIERYYALSGEQWSSLRDMLATWIDKEVTDEVEAEVKSRTEENQATIEVLNEYPR